MRTATLLVLSAVCVALAPFPLPAAEWKAGVTRAKITPHKAIWMSGYASRDHPAEGTLIDLWAKALALDDGGGHRAVLVTLDLCGIDRALSQRVCKRLQERHHLARADIALCVSHTHTGPVVGNNLRSMYFLDDRQRALVDEYTKWLEDRIVSVAGDALGATAPARLESGLGTATFAVNRRNNREEEVTRLREEGALKGPVDHDLPVLCVRDAGTGAVRAVVFGYACHATTLSFYQWSGDWPGYAQLELERKHEGATALFVAGCGADQNPLPRRTVQLAQDYGRRAAGAVDEVLGAKPAPVPPALSTRYEEIPLAFASVPPRAQLEQDSKASDRYVAGRAKLLLERLHRGEELAADYPYPVQVWRLGPDRVLLFLGGEVVVDYALRLKRELGPGAWVFGYANDVMAYIPSRRVLAEGGYEGGGAMVYYGLPSPWAPGVEEAIVKSARSLVESSRQ